MIFGSYYSGDLKAYMIVARDNNLRIYVEYMTKKNILKPMEIYINTIHEDYVIVTDVTDSRIKRLNYNTMFRVGIEEYA